MNAKLIALIMIFITNFRVCQGKRYDNYTLFTVTPVEVDHLKFLQNLESQKYIDMVFWTRPYKLYHKVQFIVNPVDRHLFIERAEHFKMQFTISVPDIQKAFDNQTIRRYLRLRTETFNWDHYHTLEDIYQWLSDLALKFPNSVELYTIGKSVEGREIFALNINRGRSKTKVIVEGCVHGNEWISAEYVTYLANVLIHANHSDGMLLDLAVQYDWNLIPILNPDGYAYSQKADRLWKKNRRTVGQGVGINLNRNFDYSFGKFASSLEPGDEEFCGPTAFSEPETKALSQFVFQKQGHLRFYFSFHGYGQKIIIPYGDRIKHVGDYSEMENYSKQAVMKMYKLYNKKYSVGTFYDTMGLRISGNSASWVKKTFKVKYAFTILMRDNGTFGYALPPSEILPNCEEMLAGMMQIMVAKQRKLRANLFGSANPLAKNWLVYSFWMVVLCSIFVI